MFDDILPSQQGMTPHQAPPAPPAPDMSMFADLLPNAGKTPVASADDSGFRPMTIHVGPQIAVDPNNPQAISSAASTLSNKPSMLTSALRGAMQGATLNFGDELKGLSAAAGSSPEAQSLPASEVLGGLRLAGEAVLPSVFGTSATDRYTQAVSQARAENELAQQTNPGSYFAGEIGGGLAALPIAPELAPFQAAQNAGLAARGGAALGNMAATGAAYGAASGIGGAQDGLENRAIGGAQGAALGGAVNPAFGSVAGALTGGIGKTANLVRQDLMARNNPQRLADQLIAERLHADGMTTSDLAQGVALGGVMTPADVAGSNVQGLVGSMARTPGPAQTLTRDFLDARQFGADAIPSQGDRVQGAITGLMGGQNLASGAVAERIALRSKEAAPAYKAAHASQIDYAQPAGQGLLAALDRVPQAARANANKILQVSDHGGSQMVYRPNSEGELELAAAPNVRQWDYIKQGIDQLIDGHTDAVTGRVDTYGHALTGLKRELLSQLDELVPAYKVARKIFAGHSETIAAIRSGGDAFKPGTTIDEMKEALAALHSKADNEAYRLAAAKALKDKLGKLPDGTNKIRYVAGSPELRAKVALIANDEASRLQLMRFVGDETKMTMLRTKAVGNSTTADKLANDNALGEGMENLREGIHAVHNIAHMNIAALLLQGARHLQRANPAQRGAVLEAMRRTLLSPDPAAIRSFEDRLAAADVQPGAKQAVLGLFGSALSNTRKAALRSGVGQTLQRLPSTQPDARGSRANPPSMR